MVPQTQITEVKAELDYAVAHQCGPTYTGPTGGFFFVGGLLGDLVPGWQLLQNSMATMTHFWEAKPDHALAWDGEYWVYGKVAPAPVPVAPKRPEPAPVDKPAPKKRGRPKGSKNKK